MNPSKKPPPSKRPVWRISPNAPLGEWVDADAPVQRESRESRDPTMDLADVEPGSWIVSSFDLLRGTDVDESGDTVPGDLFDQMFFPDHAAAQKPKA